MLLAEKLQIKPDATVALIAVPDTVDLQLPNARAANPAVADAVVAFVAHAADLGTIAGPALQAASDDRLTWIAYPKGGQLGTDLNRDRLAALAREHGARPVRQIAIDEVWSALRFRSA